MLPAAILAAAMVAGVVAPAESQPESARFSALTSGTVSWIGQPEGLPSTDIASVVGDRDGRIWLGHNRGLTRLALASEDPASGTMTHFGDHDGAQGNGYAEGAWAVGDSVAGGSGLIYLAGEGITVFDPREVGVSRSTPRIVFTSLEILHRVVARERLRAAVEALGAAEAAEGGPAATVSIGFAAYPFLPHAPDALTWEQTLDLADHALRLSKRRKRNSYTGLRATADVTPAVVLEFLARRGAAPLPDVIEILTPPGQAEATTTLDTVSP